MEVIGHQEIITDEPCVGVAPDSFQGFLDGRLREPRLAIFRANSEENDGRLVEGNFYALRGYFAPGKSVPKERSLPCARP
jgi:hypothetical protein